MNIKLLVFPCGSEIGLEVYRSLIYSRNIELIGGTSVDDHGEYIFDNIIKGIPLFSEDNFIEEINKIIKENNIDAIYPTMDGVIEKLSKYRLELDCDVIAPDYKITELCLSKTKTYNLLNEMIRCPDIYRSKGEYKYPMFAKPDIGYGSRGAKLIVNQNEISEQLIKYPNTIFCEYLPGDEYTVDCFTNKAGEILFCGARKRNRVVNGISVSTIPVDNSEFLESISIINKKVGFRGAWFAQFKRNSEGDLVLLEIAARFGGSSSLHRNMGVNFALLTIFDYYQYPIYLVINKYALTLDRALSNKFKLDIKYKYIYIDFDDCLYINNKINVTLISFIFQEINKGKLVVLISKHDGDLTAKLKDLRISQLFDQVIHLSKEDCKYKHVISNSSIFFDDSFFERKQMRDNLGIYVFSPDMIESLID
ncbi:ATP-grasp domain-containing protein [Acinetobacter johnsonii]|nr:ATP-grasp domain-containing protein [Acinetobacter johnsonii]